MPGSSACGTAGRRCDAHRRNVSALRRRRSGSRGSQSCSAARPLQRYSSSLPNFFGSFEDLEAIARLTHEAGALLVVATNPILLGIMEPPSAYGADIVVGEGQSLGGTTSYGGPGLGFFACRQEHVRQMPGRVVGRTVDVDGAMAFVLTLSTGAAHTPREGHQQHLQQPRAQRVGGRSVPLGGR